MSASVEVMTFATNGKIKESVKKHILNIYRKITSKCSYPPCLWHGIKGLKQVICLLILSLKLVLVLLCLLFLLLCLLLLLCLFLLFLSLSEEEQRQEGREEAERKQPSRWRGWVFSYLCELYVGFLLWWFSLALCSFTSCFHVSLYVMRIWLKTECLSWDFILWNIGSF